MKNSNSGGSDTPHHESVAPAPHPHHKRRRHRHHHRHPHRHTHETTAPVTKALPVNGVMPAEQPIGLKREPSNEASTPVIQTVTAPTTPPPIKEVAPVTPSPATTPVAKQPMTAKPIAQPPVAESVQSKTPAPKTAEPIVTAPTTSSTKPAAASRAQLKPAQSATTPVPVKPKASAVEIAPDAKRALAQQVFEKTIKYTGMYNINGKRMAPSPSFQSAVIEHLTSLKNATLILMDRQLSAASNNGSRLLSNNDAINLATSVVMKTNGGMLATFSGDAKHLRAIQALTSTEVARITPQVKPRSWTQYASSFSIK